MHGVFSRANAELHDPMSPYYLGAPSTVEILDNYMRGGYRTNYFGSNAYSYLARPQGDSVEIYHHEREARRKKNLWTGIGIAALAIGAYLFRGKIPFIGKYLKKTNTPKA